MSGQTDKARPANPYTVADTGCYVDGVRGVYVVDAIVRKGDGDHSPEPIAPEEEGGDAWRGGGMATLRIVIEMDNEAFAGGDAERKREVRRILKDSDAKISDVVHYLDSEGEKLMDVNGNTVGRVSVED